MATHDKKMMKKFIFISLLSMSTSLFASGGGDEPSDYYVSRYMPEIDLDTYQSGNLGVVLSSYPRIFLYPAWRSIMLGHDELKKDTVVPGRLKEICCNASGWIDERDPTTPKMKWGAIRATVTTALPTVRLVRDWSDQKNPYRYYSSCTNESYKLAILTLTELKNRPDATPELLKEWVEGQDAVYEFCGYRPNVVVAGEIFPVPVTPPKLLEARPKVWQQYRDYQIAASAFYAGNNDQANLLFSEIGKTKDHPMYQWGEYLALRAKIRGVSLAHRTNLTQTYFSSQPTLNDGFEVFNNDVDDATIKEISQATQKILKNPKLADTHEFARASLRAFKYRAMPHQQFIFLSKQLSDYRKNPNVDDVLGDWRRLANYFFDNRYDGSKEKESLAQTMRTQYDFLDWMMTVQSCAESISAEQLVACKNESSHAVDFWGKAQKADDYAKARAWFVAVLMTTNQTSDEIETQAAKVPESAPEFLTVEYNLARVMRLSGKLEKAKSVLDKQLNKSFNTQSTLNLFLQERFASATSLEDASKYLFRDSAGQINPDTKEFIFNKNAKSTIAQDGIRWINNALSVNDLMALSKIDSLPVNLRTQFAVMAWFRADLLGKDALANEAASSVVELSPAMKRVVNQYLNAEASLERRHALLVAGVGNGVSIAVTEWASSTNKYTNESATYDNANICCVISPPAQADAFNNIEQVPNSPQVSTEVEVRDVEIAALSTIDMGSPYLANHLLEYAKVHPDDENLPRLLSMAIYSNKYGAACGYRDTNACRETFHKCFTLLHKKYGQTKWAKDTRYWY